MYRTNNKYPLNPDSSGASAFLEKTLEKKPGVRNAYNVQNKTQIPTKSRFQRRTWKQVQEKNYVGCE